MSYIQSNAVISLPNGNASIAVADSGKYFILVQSAAQTISLPAVQRGLSYTFILGTADIFTSRIVATAGTPIVGHVVSGPLAAPVVTVGAGTIAVNFSTTCVVGDRIDIFSDGINWFVSGKSGSNAANTAITFTA